MVSQTPQALIWRWYRNIIFSNRNDYPNLLALELKKRQWFFRDKEGN